MTPFELIEPATLGEALALLDPDDPNVRPIAGGTALMLMMKSGLYRPRRLVSLRAIAQYKPGDGRKALGIIISTPEGHLWIGAMVRLAHLARSPAILEAAPVIAQTLLTHSNARVRNVATMGGNLAHADPHMDLPPVLIALGADIHVIGPNATRSIPAEEFFTGYMETALANNELIESVYIPPLTGRRAAYEKVTARAADDWPALGIAVSVGPSDVRVAIGAATETAMRLPQAEALLAGRRLDDKLIREAGRCAAAEAPVVGDLHGSAAYKRVLVEVHLRRALHKALAA